ncbi:Variant-specific surface protein [Giardia duodenalis]|uniref:Variant-specific surface protein n=3 Tax=Giardia intestinalis TaxID=5741 RepID=V6TS55_GIAIN|nr:Variant-specific surface protein [Giardia intestinalis]
MFLLINCLIASTLAATCSSSQTNCADGKCEMISTTEICTQCVTGHVPVNGKCVAKASATNCKTTDGSAAGDQTCGKCEGTTFMYKGGCYDKEAAPGNLICKTAGSTAGICQDCQAGYFKNPANADTSDSCILCNDTTGVTIGADSTAKTYKGVDGCKTCDAPTAISEATGTKAATCTECNANLYLKTVTGSSTETSCVTAEDCKTGYFPNDNVDNKKKCILCNTVANGGITNCGECSLLPSTAEGSTVLITCTKCSTNSLSPLKDACLTSCPAGTYETGSPNKVCTACHTSCAGCKDDNTAASCTACYPGSVLSYGSDTTKGTCIAECTGKYLENCADGQCTAVLGGSKYCSKCKSGYVPVDGICVLAETARAAPAGCTPSNTDGVCTACTGKYFLESGGCYQAEKFPGNTLCTTTDSNGKCTGCANGQTADSGTGSCPACPTNCASCTGTSSKTCTKCFSGYYLDSANACKKCSETSGTITGVENCISCEKPSNGNGAVTCYVKTSGGGSSDNSTGGGPNLSSGAIAGISVAVIVVVGGLVGFLCW